MSIPDRSRFDDDVAAILNPLAQLRAANDALLAQNESLLDGAAKRQEYVEAIEARVVELSSQLADYRRQLALLQLHTYGEAA